MWSWAIENVAQDIKEQGKLLFSFMDTLTWWLQPEIKKQMNKQKTDAWPEAADYIEELKRNGASDDYLAKELDEIEKRKKESAETENDQDDNIQLIRGPNGSV